MTNHTLIIEPGLAEKHYWRDLWHDLWRYRELFYVLAWRDVSVRYKPQPRRPDPRLHRPQEPGIRRHPGGICRPGGGTRAAGAESRLGRAGWHNGLHRTLSPALPREGGGSKLSPNERM